MNVLYFEQDGIRIEGMKKQMLDFKEIKNIYSCKNEDEFEQAIKIYKIDVILSRFIFFFESNLVSIMKESNAKIKTLAYLSTDFDREDRLFYQLSDYCYLTKYNPSIEDIVEGLNLIYRNGVQNHYSNFN